MPRDIDPQVRAMAENFVATGTNKRAVVAVRIMLEKGEVTTDDLSDEGYRHTPRAIGDARDEGIPIVTGSAPARSGKNEAVYWLGSASDIVEGRIGGRSALPKAFKHALVARYDSRDCITGAKLDPKVLQIDHRVPYRVAGDAGLADRDTDAYMLLDGSSQRAKSWACEHCRNLLELRDPEICGTCFWARPEHYEHIAMEQIRRTEISWQEEDVAVHDTLRARAEERGITVGELIKQLARMA